MKVVRRREGTRTMGWRSFYALHLLRENGTFYCCGLVPGKSHGRPWETVDLNDPQPLCKACQRAKRAFEQGRGKEHKPETYKERRIREDRTKLEQWNKDMSR